MRREENTQFSRRWTTDRRPTVETRIRRFDWPSSDRVDLVRRSKMASADLALGRPRMGNSMANQLRPWLIPIR